MRGARAGLIIGSLGALAAIGACALDEAGTAGDSGVDVASADVQNDVSTGDAGGGMEADVAPDYNVPDLGTGETEAGLPCTCVTTPPGGYTFVEYLSIGRPNCTTGYGNHTDLFESPTALPSTCTCTCAASPSKAPTCACGSDPATFDMNAGNGTCSPNLLPIAANQGSCYNTPQSLSPGSGGLNNAALHPTTPCVATGGSCAGPNATHIIPAYTSDDGRSCDLTTAPGMCMTGECIPTPQSSYLMCVTNKTTDPCPMAFPVTHYVGTGISDTRVCGPDACNTCELDGSTCAAPQISFYDAGNNCMGSVATLPGDNSCNAVGWGDSITFPSTRYSVGLADAGACSFPGNYTLQGAVTLSGGFNVCCL